MMLPPASGVPAVLPCATIAPGVPARPLEISK